MFLLGPGVPLGVLACPILHLTSSLSSVGDRYSSSHSLVHREGAEEVEKSSSVGSIP